ncbi:MAG TPA: metallophosphoesterase [Gaiellaceae bacterium]|nr:metallophosphoesterase [Gaiellaceae bacterium]
MRLRVLEVGVPGLPRELDGVRIAHLSDFHLGVPSRGRVAVERAVEWVAERDPDLVCVTGDLVSRPRGLPLLQFLLAQLDSPFVVLGNHDHAVSRDPFSQPVSFDDLATDRLLRDESVEVELRGCRVEVAGVDPRSWLRLRGSGFEPSDAAFRLLLCHFPRVLDFAEPGRFNLILSGHLHAGQIVLPYGRGKVMLAHPRTRYSQGLFRRGGTVMHVSPGLGTTFVPFRFFARPEATELVLRYEEPWKGTA